MNFWSRMIGGLVMAAALAGAAPDTVDFDRDVRPILSERCFTCHGPDEGTRLTALRFDTEQGAFGALSSGGFAIVKGSAEQSKLIERITSTDPVSRMPPAYKGMAKLPEAEIAVLRRWIDEGARWSKHWSFEAPRRPEAPEVANAAWAKHPIDRLIYTRLQKEGLEPASQASRAALIRRVTLDLTGLPPTPDEVLAFEQDTSPDAYEKVVDRLLASARFGERMAVDWLDAARYADTNGYQSDGTRSMWRWRDWVVAAFNRNMPFDEFTIEQLAGDLMPNATLDQKIATAFNRNHRTSAEGGIVEEEFLAEYAADRASTTSTVWLGLTMGCARCHDHKYDPLKQKEFYELLAFFNNLPERGLVYNFGNDKPTIKAPTVEQERKLEELDGAVKRAEQKLAKLEPEIANGVREWAGKLAQSGGEDWSIEEGLTATYDFERSKAPYAPWGKPPEGLKRGPDRLRIVADGKRGSAAKLGGDETTDLGDVAGFDYDEPFSFSFWLRPESKDGAILTRMHEAGEEQGYGFYLRDSKLRFEFTMRQTDHSMRIVSKAPLEMGQWQHITLTYAGELPASAGTRLYVDGKPFPFEVEWDDLKWPVRYRSPLKLGTGGGKPSIEGLVDELRIYRRVLSPLEVQVAALDRSLSEIAARPERSEAEQEKLRLAYLDRRAPKQVEQARAALKLARDKREYFYDSVPTVMVFEEREDVRPTYLLKRGAYDAPGEQVQPGVPSVLPPLPVEGRASRLDLARWIVSRDNPLTARVTVNRYWQQLFGVGLVKTVDDFGSQGERPVQPELLDWLAVEFMDSGWDVKGIFKTMVMSQGYQQDFQGSPELIQRDPENRLIARRPRFRLPAEMIRDQALAASGLLDTTMGGPPVKPYQPLGLWEELSGTKYEQSSGQGLYRRSLYTYWKRTVAPPSMATFDASDRESCTVSRSRTNTPLQALTLMNDVTYVEAARKLAERMMLEGGAGPAARIDYGFQRVLARHPRAAEAETLRAALAGFVQDYQSNREAAKALLRVGESRRAEKLEPRELAAYAAVASLILNLDETVTKQ
ncbi:MAG: DUF1553 domain-containing protein [Acidobacteria bacterium]|nr:DUF1553 domain-containing protein [Acidobacteriota bacterium]